MELELGLALPIHNPIKGFEIDDYLNKCHKVGLMPAMSGGGGCNLESSTRSRSSSSSSNVKNKRSFDEAFGEMEEASTHTLPLLLWNGQPNEEDDRKGHKPYSQPTNKNYNEDRDLIVGWPPIKSSRKKMLHGGEQVEINDEANYNNNYRVKNNNNKIGGSKSMYVKVKMEGVGIVRKIDMKLYHSYHALKSTLITMFSKYQRCNQNGASNYTLTYQDKEGDWLLATDVPWQTFIESVQRLKIRRSWEDWFKK
ncbi:hypothetical protein FNV43_RR12286 [Rhamnella rubrinervis]|uniref:Auxin-responsive protein n=1 Tax=Rhamnella rubrinervis TaxID=2594499 RepID=A0A8K0H728_9ROSA|nr:hypothetical protein FNV43_RR12286 [Rhamnella rubrinervis]